MTLLQYAVHPNNRPDPAALNTARRACAAFLKTLKSDYIVPAESEPPLIPLPLLRDRGIPTVSDLALGEALRDRDFYQATGHINKRRRLLLSLVRNDGWTWDAVASSITTNRATNLDDDSAIDKSIAK